MWTLAKTMIFKLFALLGRLFVRWMEAVGRTSPLSLEAGFLIEPKRPEDETDRGAGIATQVLSEGRPPEARGLGELPSHSGPHLLRRRRLDRRHGPIHLGR